WIPGKSAAQITANIVIASAARLTPVRHFCRNIRSIADISVPAWPIPIHQTKLVISHPQPMVRLRFQEPIPNHIVQMIQNNPNERQTTDTANARTQVRLGVFSVGEQISSVIWW